MNLEVIIGLNIRRLRKSKQWSQDHLADRYGCIKPYISQIENGKTWIGKEVFYKMCQILDACPEDLVNVEPEVSQEIIHKIKTIIASDWRDFFDITVSVLTLAGYADPAELAEIKGELKNLHRHILKKINK